MNSPAKKNQYLSQFCKDKVFPHNQYGNSGVQHYRDKEPELGHILQPPGSEITDWHPY